MKFNFLRPLLLAIAGIFLFVAASFGQTPSAEEIDEAVRSLRDIGGEKLTDEQKKTKAVAIDAAWKVLSRAGTPAIARLKEEIQKVDAGTRKDDFFKLNASVVIWDIGKLSEAESIAAIWGSTPVSAQYTYVFLTAMDAAKTRDPKALPMLRAVLKDDKGSIYFSMHAMNVTWPLTHEFVWGTYGSAGLPLLHQILETTTDPVELRSAMSLLTRAQYLPSLARIRQLAQSADKEVRRVAIVSLGIYGHPKDYDLLVAGLAATDPVDIWHHAYALYEFGDTRAVPHIVPLLKNKDVEVRFEAGAALMHLLTPASLEAAKAYVVKVTEAREKEYTKDLTSSVEAKLPPGYDKKPEAEKARILTAIRDARLQVDKDDQKLDNQQLKAAMAEWKTNGRIYRGTYERIRAPQIIAAATVEDIESLIDAKARFYPRLSDECLYETRDIDKAIKYIGRSRYRVGLGITEKAELK